MAEPFTLQLHITDHCQLQCSHCYRDAQKQDLPLTDLQAIVEQFLAFCSSRQVPARLTIAGGEPLLRYGDLLTLTRQATGAGAQVHLLSNGLLLTPQRIAELKAAGCMRVQISIDGDEPAHDALRGEGVYRQSVAALHLLRRHDLWRTISVTLGQWNQHTLPSVMALAQETHAKLFVARYVPCGTGLALRDQMLRPAEWLAAMRSCKALAPTHPAGVAMRDPLYVPLAEVSPDATLCAGGCSIGYGGLAVDSDGTAYPCRRLPLSLGNVLSDGLERIWSHPLLEELRDRDKLRGACGQCRWRWRCGGCRAIAHATTADPLAADPQCPFRPRGGVLRRLIRRSCPAPASGR